MHIERFEIAHRFRGPPRSGNGGYVCGRIAKHLGGAVAARLKAPPPLGKELRLESSPGHARLYDGEVLIGEAKPAELDLLAPPPPSFEESKAASSSFLGFRTHPFPGCFVCGPERRLDDGLRIFPGQLAGTPVIAAPWSPDASLVDDSGTIAAEFVWSALDCTGGFAVLPAPAGSGFVLGELLASIDGTIPVAEHCVVVGWPLGEDGRKRFAGSAIYDSNGKLVAKAHAVWLQVPLSTWG